MNVSPIMEGVPTTVLIQQGVIIAVVLMDLTFNLTNVTALKVSTCKSDHQHKTQQ